MSTSSFLKGQFQTCIIIKILLYLVMELLFTLPRNGQRTSNLFFKILRRDGSVEGNLKRIRYVWCINIMVRFTNNNSSLHIFFQCNKLTLCFFPLWIRWSIPSGFVKPQPIVFDRKTMAEKCNNQGLKSFLVIKNTMMEWNVAWIILLWLFILN